MTNVVLAVAVFALWASTTLGAQESGGALAQGSVPSIRITSPLGRTGAPATVRIVMQAQWPVDDEGKTHPHQLSVRFLVDAQEVGVVDKGPPYAVSWIDDNPFEAREISVEARLIDGSTIREAIRLPAFEIVDSAEVKSVVVEAAVYDKSGRTVSDLNVDAFVIKENGEPQEVDLFAKEGLPSTIALLVDNSQSMARRIDSLRRTAEVFAKSLGERDRIIIVPFNSIIGTITGPTTDPQTISEAIAAMSAGGGTAILDAVARAARLLDGIEGRRAIILLTDGFDENSTIDLEAATAAAAARGVTVYAVGIGGVTGISLQGESTFRSLTERTGGRPFFPWRDIDVPGVAREILRDQQTRYLITYTPSNQRKDGTWRSISVSLPEGYSARARDGYRAALPPPIRPTIEFTVTDRTRGYVNVSVEDLEVIEEGTNQRVETFQEAAEPVSIALLLDASGSMTRSAPLVKATAKEFVTAVRPEDSLALITFADEPLFGHLLGVGRDVTIAAIDRYTTEGGTTLYDALWNGLQHLKTAKGRRAIVVLTDGRDENRAGTGPASARRLSDVQELARQVGATIFPVGLGTRVDQAPLEQLATASGGDAYLEGDPERLAAAFRRIIENLRQRYVLSYTSSNTEHDGRWRRVQIRAKNPSLVFKAAAGYFAPAQ